MSLSLREALTDGAARLRAAGVESARLDARVLLAAAMRVSPDEVLTGEDLQPEELDRFDALLARRARREPLAYITGTKEFWSRSFAVGPGVLVPRPETETLVEAALHGHGQAIPVRVLDIGTGSGCILISFLDERTNATGIGVDASDAALAWARKNAISHGVPERCRLETIIWEPEGAECFDVIFANPPYLTAAEFGHSDPEIRNWEPVSALVAGEDGLDAIRSLGPVLWRRLAERGKAYVEIGAGQAQMATEILVQCGLDVKAIIPDLSGIPRCLIAGHGGAAALAPKKSVGNSPPTG